ncbi:MAG: DUF2520 domain-containing protein [Muribaculaceae bacterium]|jgi:predicted short-subunit dehydrogenase-like oxidoreductase (DUF2520 family)|nr:DUF2520 domain-containing protein [Muribaculaceae bacterium]
MPRIVLVGAGNVATHLSRALGDDIVAVCSRNIEHARKLAEPIGAQATDDFSRVAGFSPDIVILSIADNATDDVVAAIGPIESRPLVVHTSGTVEKEALLPLSHRTGVLYPLQSFSVGADVDISEVPFFTEASDEADYALVDAVARSISPHVHHADAGHRRVLHIAGVFTNNFPNILLECVEQLLGSAGYPLDVVRPLLKGTVDKAFALSPHDAQTGPARRGDFDVISRQCNALPDELKPVYKELTALILRSHNIENEQNRL